MDGELREVKQAYFDSLAERWDSFSDPDLVRKKLDAAFDLVGIGRNEVILDVGCGTGTMTAVLLDRLGANSRVVAIDIAQRMLDIAARKVRDPRVEWRQCDVTHLPFDAGRFDRVLCYSVWPHIPDSGTAAQELHRVLKVGGSLHILHTESRTRINDIHRNAGDAIRGDMLPAAAELARILEQSGMEITRVMDSDEIYLISAVRITPAGKPEASALT